MAKRIKDMTPEEIEAELQVHRLKRDRSRRLGAKIGVGCVATAAALLLIVLLVAAANS